MYVLLAHVSCIMMFFAIFLAITNISIYKHAINESDKHTGVLIMMMWPKCAEQ